MGEVRLVAAALGPAVATSTSTPTAGLSFDAPADDGSDSYLSDPAHPVPYRHRPISPTYPGGGWPAWLVEDQRFVENRPDVLTWQTEPLKRTSTSPAISWPSCSRPPPAPTAIGW